MNKWDSRFLSLARHVAGWSKGPDTKVGAVVAHGKHVESMGFNGAPEGFDDAEFLSMTKADQHACVVHAEDNALQRARNAAGSTIYVWPLLPCSGCAALIVAARVRRVVVSRSAFSAGSEKWQAEGKAALEIFQQNFVEVLALDEEEG